MNAKIAKARGAAIRARRQERGMTVDLLAEKAQMPAAAILEIESGRRVITLPQMRSAALALGVSEARICETAFALYDRASNLTGGPKS